MQSTAVLNLLDAHTAVERAAASPEAALTTLGAVFAAVPDPRSRHGQRYDLPFLLTCLVAALLCGCNWMRQNSESVVVGSQRVGYPSSSIGER